MLCTIPNSIVQDGLKQIDQVVVKIHDSIKYLKFSGVRNQKFQECVKLVSARTKKGLCQEMSMMWNSTYLMLKSALFYHRAFQHLELSDSNYRHCPSLKEWEKVVKNAKFLKIFYDATLKFSGSKYPTINLYLPLTNVA